MILLQNNINMFSKYDFDQLFDEVAKYYFKLREEKIEKSKMSSSAKFDAKERIDKDKEIIAILKDMTSGYKDLKSFLEDIALDSVNMNTEGDRLLITTIHSAKGLEWPIVIIIDCIDKEMSDYEEELRCLYVAMTRAETELILSIPRYALVNGNVVYNEVSRFINGSEEYFKEMDD